MQLLRSGTTRVNTGATAMTRTCTHGLQEGGGKTYHFQDFISGLSDMLYVISQLSLINCCAVQYRMKIVLTSCSVVVNM